MKMLIYERHHANKVTTEVLLSATGGTERDIPWPLPNMVEIPEKEFWHWQSIWGSDIQAWCGHKQVDYTGDKAWATITLYYAGHDELIDGGFAVAYCYESRVEKTIYYKWRKCNHKFKRTLLGNCWHKYTCELCSKSYEVDSSG